MESFFSLLQKNVLDTRRWETREELRLATATWIETKYNRRRRQRASASSPRSSLRWSTRPQTRPEHHQPRASTKPGADLTFLLGC
jgi:transposase InsO family protein